MSDNRHQCDICGGAITDRRWIKVTYRDDEKKDKEEMHQEFHVDCYERYIGMYHGGIK